MTDKKISYRIKLIDGRVIGPFALAQLKDVYKKGHLVGQERYQHFPHGEWLDLNEFPEIKNIFFQLRKERELAKGNFTKETQIISRIDKLKEEIQKIEEEEKEQESKIKKEQFQEFKFNRPDDNADEVDLGEKVDSKPVEDLNKTVVKKVVKISNEGKTVIRQLSEEEKLEVQKLKEEKEEIKEEAPLPAVEEIKEEEISQDMKTQVFSVDDLSLTENIEEIEKEIEQKEILADKKFEVNNDKSKLVKNIEFTDIKTRIQVLNKKKVSTVFFVVCVIAIVLIMGDEEEVKHLPPIVPFIDYPVEFTPTDPDKAQEQFEQGIKLTAGYTLENSLKKITKFSKSIEFQKTSRALGQLIKANAEAYEHLYGLSKATLIKNPSYVDNEQELLQTSATNLFNMIREANLYLLSDINVLLGSNLFFNLLGKYEVSINNFKRYLYNKGEKDQVNVDFFALFFKSLVMADRAEESQTWLKKLLDISTNARTVSYYDSIFYYYYKQNDIAQADQLIREGIKKFPKSVKLLIEFCDVLIQDQNFNTLEKVLDKIKELQYERSYKYYSKYLEYTGMLFAFRKQTKKAVEFFKKALVITESNELRNKLSLLQIGRGGKQLVNLVAESKVIDLINQSKDARQNLDWAKAFSLAIEASDKAYENKVHVVQTNLYLSKLQTERGYFDSAIDTLKKLRKEFPFDRDVKIELIKTYIEAYKFNDAKTELKTLLENGQLGVSEEATIRGYLYFKANDLAYALDWLRRSINYNPLNENDYYLLGELFYIAKKFKRAQKRISEAMELDPTKLEYKIMYAKILYELSGANVAIGYLDGILKENEVMKSLRPYQISTIEGEMAIFYYRSGQINQFKVMKEKISNTFKAGPNLYKFLIKASLLEDKKAEFVSAATKYLQIQPGDLQTRMQLGEYYFNAGDYTNAKIQFLKVQERLETYPKVLYYLSQIYLSENSIDKAMEFAEREVVANPNLEYGHLLLGKIYFKKEDFAKALMHYKKAQNKNSRSVEALTGLAYVKYRQNDMEEALDLYLKAQKVEPNNKSVRRQLGYVYMALGQSSLAIESFKVYLDLAPEAEDRSKIEGLIRQLQ